MRVWSGNSWEVRLGRWQDSAPDEVDCIITDPPYTDHVSQNCRSGGPKRADGRMNVQEKRLSFDGVDPASIGASLTARARRWCVIWCAVEQVGLYRQAAPDHYVRAGLWIKSNPTPQFTGDRPAMWGEACAIFHSPDEKKRWNGGGAPGIWRGQYCRGDRVHETQKPLWLMLEIVQSFTDPGELVWDPYGGSMTTGVACLLTGRRFLGHEMQERYARAGAERLEATTQGLTLEDYRNGQQSLFGEAS